MLLSINITKTYFFFSLLFFVIVAIMMIIRDVKKDKYNLRFYDCRMRLSSALIPLILALADYLSGMIAICPSIAAIDISTGPMIMLLCPARHEKAAMSYRHERFLFCMQLALVIPGFFVGAAYAELKLILSSIGAQLLLLWYLARREYVRYGNIRKLFSNLAVWHGACDISRLIYSFALALAIGLVFHDGLGWAVACVWTACALYIVCYIRVVDDTSCLVGKEVEGCIKEAINGRLYERVGATPEDDRRMIRLFERAKAVMEKDKPYRDELFSLPDFASMLLTNKVYLSRTINMMAGCNFRNFVNWYRIEDAKRMIMDKPETKLADVMLDCGFHTHQTFESAFLRQCGESPKEYQERVKVESLKLK